MIPLPGMMGLLGAVKGIFMGSVKTPEAPAASPMDRPNGSALSDAEQFGYKANQAMQRELYARSIGLPNPERFTPFPPSVTTTTVNQRAGILPALAGAGILAGGLAGSAYFFQTPKPESKPPIVVTQPGEKWDVRVRMEVDPK